MSELVQRALGYPYAIPSQSYVLVGGKAFDLAAIEVDLPARIPLLAYGSNASPEVLARKLKSAPKPVPVIRGTLHGFDVVYSAHISRYGSVPAALQRSPGTEVDVSVAHLTKEQLRLVSTTEPNYELKTLREVSCRLDNGSSPAELHAYISRHGCLLVRGREVALSSIAARYRRFPPMDQRQVLEYLRDALQPGQPLEHFIAERVSQAVP